MRIETVDTVELLTPGPITKGSRVRLKQPKLPESTWDITVWDAPTYFEWTQKAGGTTSVAGHRVEALGEGRARLTLTLDMRGLLIPIMGRFYKDLINRLHEPRSRGHEAGGRIRLITATRPLRRRTDRGRVPPGPTGAARPRGGSG